MVEYELVEGREAHQIWPADGPVEPLVISFSGCCLFGLMLLVLYRKQVAGISTFFLWWVIGVVIALIVSAALMIFIISKLGLPGNTQMGFFTLMVGILAGIISSRSAGRLRAVA